MPAMNTAFCKKLSSILTPAQKAELGEWIILQQAGITAGPITTTATRSTRNTATRTRAKKAGDGGTAGITGNSAALLNYFSQHPTANLSQASLREISPFKTWRPNVLGRQLGILTKAGKLTKNGKGWQFSNVDRTMTAGARKAA
jgi:hypothetical protein